MKISASIQITRIVSSLSRAGPQLLYGLDLSTARQQAGRVPSSTLIRQLSHRSDINALSEFAEQLGNVDRTIFLLEWISNQPMRQEVTAMTNKVEGYHSFSKWLRFGGDVIAENDPDEQQKYLRYNDLLASAVILQNVIDMSQIIADLRREGWTIAEEDLSLLSPYVTPGVKRFGEYGLNFDRELEPSIPASTLATEAPAVEGWIA